ncbi:hypothetical protein A3C23_02230 [Candidatus Roizmanbacteria bacterium RIFCSPHIGHO2_02_FULL_37_13b]|uniref:Enoyl reductase (ER) domain-containing protein n=1 Tax=Candidatus Roizmanbacteria bacterium RIFCSPLOWO2_02_FULL_36_11 TaxID=1802071 RepID=A0A1F7JGL3_9BACT|nr:MAG: hypothetical protein A3C23_02230 [Candidatus Roizmanbacteria bacterium RIFCSPHIGHO2_02_FULL_37_13b]OGK54755.1 MAG: hypothetical protein A3H78_05700 [Candidatus Roizmanbacteria bacterium RIFCSPLOWO2_02_FULL_36_11]
MKSIQINKYGTSDVLEINDNTPDPTLRKGQLLIDVFAASINPVDLAIRSGYLAQMAPLQFPVTLGGDFAGIVKEIDVDVTNFKIGDEVYGQAIILNGGSGSFAQSLEANSRNTALKPKTASFEEAGALPLVGTCAIQALEEHIKLAKNNKILIHGGAGGIGHIAIQLAKFLGAYVTTTVNTDDIEFVKKLGVDEVIDYKTQAFETILKDYDAVFDTVGGETTNKSFGVLKNGGVLVSMLGKPDEKLAKEKNITAVGQRTKTNTEDLNRLSELVDNGKIKVSIDKVYSLDKIKEAASHQETHPRGKIVLKIRE